MSGNFVQRGEPAIMDKYVRAKNALKNGADLVLELSPLISSSSAGYFGEGAVVNLSKLGVVDTLCFGAEEADKDLFKKAARILSENDPALNNSIKENLKEGLSYAAAREKALTETHDFDKRIISDPNNILALEYETAILNHKTGFETYITKRNDPGYNSLDLEGETASALAVRKLIQERKWAEIAKFVPKETDAIDFSELVFKDEISSFLHYKLLNESIDGFDKYHDISKNLSERICNKLSEFTTFSGFCDSLKTKNTAYSTISRGLLHIFLDIKKETVSEYKENGYAKYIKVLGFNKSAAPLLKKIADSSSVPLITEKNDYDKYVHKDEKLRALYLEEMRIDRNYDLILNKKYSRPIISDFSKEPVII